MHSLFSKGNIDDEVYITGTCVDPCERLKETPVFRLAERQEHHSDVLLFVVKLRNGKWNKWLASPGVSEKGRW